MTLEAADRLLAVAGLDDGPVADRLAVLFGDRGVAGELTPSERAAAELARVAAAGHLAAGPEVGAVIVEVLAEVFDLEVMVSPTAAQLASGPDGIREALRPVVVDLDGRIGALPAPARSEMRRWIDARRKAEAHRTPTARTVPVSKLHLLAAEVARVEDLVGAAAGGAGPAASPAHPVEAA